MDEISLDVYLTGRQWFWASSWMYYLGLGLSKLSVTVQFFRIFVTPKTLLVTKCTIAFVMSWTIISVCVAAFECIPTARYWDKRIPGKCINGSDTFLANASMNILTDFIIIGIPVPSLFKLQVSIAKKIGLMFAFSLGLVVCAISIARIPMVILAFRSGKPGNQSLMMWSTIELHVAIVCACLPSIRPLFVSFLRFTGIDSYLKTITPTSIGAKSSSARKMGYGRGRSATGGSTVVSAGRRGGARVEYIEMEEAMGDSIQVQRSVEVKSEVYQGTESRSSRKSDEDSIDSTAVALGPTVNITNGTLEGIHSSQYDQDFFLGIPFAEPPIGDLRFRVPKPFSSAWSDVKPVTTYSKECVGYGNDQLNFETSEDCLFLNVVRPADIDPNEPLPVAVWIHGGRFTQGGGVDQRYNMSFTIQNAVEIGKPFIGVTLNYRLSAWGFLMGEEVEASGNGNLGLRDQRLALEWVQENIAAFGGDPTKVTIFGESAGAMSVGFQLVAYGGRDDKLFRAAIMQSGSPVYYYNLNDSSALEPKYQSLLADTDCSDLACLRSLPFEDLNGVLNQTKFITWVPAIDHDFIQDFTSTQLVTGNFVKVPIIAGTNTDEGTAFSPLGIDTETDFINVLTSLDIPGYFIPQILSFYPDEPARGIPGSPPLPADFRFSLPQGAQYRRSAAFFTDYTFVASRRLTCRAWAMQNVTAYCYRFNAQPASVTWQRGVTHFAEVPFSFYNLLGVGFESVKNPFEGKPASYAELARTMASMWAAFIVDLDPNRYDDDDEALVTASGVHGEEAEEVAERMGGPWGAGPGGRAAAAALWPKYDLGDPRDFVFDANVTSFVEMDTYRAAGVDMINANAAAVFGR
ncbi:Acetylcholinesterase [Lasiodiplodia hormozganensis]|uniref:Acetylcholinesterase n=1 Tax=Lasiodiplodia hormozganensis TaxID=869390 RepID=A0AA40D4X5_9PEZI|nr:Acetylcholinesterase [Lasiodiplodia hormozganensis]